MADHARQELLTDATHLLSTADHEAQRAAFDLDGPPLRLRDLRTLTGFSKGKFLADIERGALQARAIRTGQRTVYVVERSDAARYLKALGFAA